MSVVLHYFNGRGRAEVIRQLLTSNGVAFEDKTFTFQAWPEHKATGAYEFGYVPMLEIDGHRLVTSLAIERYLAKKFSLYPADLYQAYLVESLIDYKVDIIDTLGHLFFVRRDLQALADWFASDVKQHLKVIEARLLANHAGDEFFVGEGKTWADYSIFQFLYDTFCLPGLETRQVVLQETAPKLVSFVERFLANDAALQQWVASRPDCL
jgi:glutathione S-transferase